MKVLVEISDIFNNTTISNEDNRIVEEMLDYLKDKPLVEEVIRRGLFKEVWQSLSAQEQANFIEEQAVDFGYVPNNE